MTDFELKAQKSYWERNANLNIVQEFPGVMTYIPVILSFRSCRQIDKKFKDSLDYLASLTSPTEAPISKIR